MAWVIQKTTTYIDGKQVTDFFKCKSFGFEEYTGEITSARQFDTINEARCYAKMYLRRRKCDKIQYVKVGEQP